MLKVKLIESNRKNNRFKYLYSLEKGNSCMLHQSETELTQAQAQIIFDKKAKEALDWVNQCKREGKI